MTDETESRRRALAFNAVGPAIKGRGYWLPLSARRAVADAVLDAVADDLAAARRNAIRIQILLDEQRDRARKDAAASRASEQTLQQQIDDQAREIDRLRDQLAALHEGEEEPTSVRLPSPTPAEWLWLWNRVDPARRLEVAAQVIDAGVKAGTCFQADHETTIQRLRAELDAIEREGRTINPYDRDSDAELERIRAALRSPKGAPDA